MTELTGRHNNALTQYDPDKGLKTIAVLEAAEKHLGRGKDTTQLYKAIERKLKEQANYIVYRDGVVRHGGDRRSSSKRTELDLPKSDPGHDVAHLWRKKLTSKDEDDRTVVDKAKLEAALAEAHERCVRICEQEKPPPRGTGFSGEIEWYTPAECIALARQVLGEIDLDPASSAAAQKTVMAEQFFSLEDDGLSHQWHGRVWLNPPFSQPDIFIFNFMKKMVDEVGAGRVHQAIMLTHNSADTEWFQLGFKHANAICFTAGRIKFVDPHGDRNSPTQGQAFFYFGDNVDLCFNSFSKIGSVVVPLRAS
jgi:ParB family chromosome partitioning protein